MGRLLWGQRALASALICLILALVILIPLFSLLTIITSQALEFSSTVSQGLQTGHLWQWVAAKLDAVKGYLHHLNLPLPPEQFKLESIVQTVLTRASAFIYANAVGLIKGFTYFFFDLILVLFITFFMFLQGDDFINEIKQLSPLEPALNEEILRETELTIKATLWGTVMVPAAVIPLVGSAIIWEPAAAYLLLTGHVGAGVEPKAVSNLIILVK